MAKKIYAVFHRPTKSWVTTPMGLEYEDGIASIDARAGRVWSQPHRWLTGYSTVARSIPVKHDGQAYGPVEAGCYTTTLLMRSPLVWFQIAVRNEMRNLRTPHLAYELGRLDNPTVGGYIAAGRHPAQAVNRAMRDDHARAVELWRGLAAHVYSSDYEIHDVAAMLSDDDLQYAAWIDLPIPDSSLQITADIAACMK